MIAWNGFPKLIGKAFTAKKRKNINTANNNNQLINESNRNVDVIWINLRYDGTHGRKATRYLTKKVKFKVTRSTKNFAFMPI